LVDWSTRRRDFVDGYSLRGCSCPSSCLNSMTAAEWLYGRCFEHTFHRQPLLVQGQFHLTVVGQPFCWVGCSHRWRTVEHRGWRGLSCGTGAERRCWATRFVGAWNRWHQVDWLWWTGCGKRPCPCRCLVAMYRPRVLFSAPSDPPESAVSNVETLTVFSEALRGICVVAICVWRWVTLFTERRVRTEVFVRYVR